MRLIILSIHCRFERVDGLRKVLNAAWKAVTTEDKETGGIGGKMKSYPQKELHDESQ